MSNNSVTGVNLADACYHIRQLQSLINCMSIAHDNPAYSAVSADLLDLASVLLDEIVADTRAGALSFNEEGEIV